MSESKAKLIIENERRAAIVRAAANLIDVIDGMDWCDAWTTQEVHDFLKPLREALKGSTA